MRLDEEKLEALRSWGERLRQAGGEESVAVGRAILMLIEEIDRLHIELWHARMQPSGRESVATDEAATVDEPVGSSLHARLQRVLQREAPADPAEQPDSDTERARSASAQAWIEALRRQDEVE